MKKNKKRQKQQGEKDRLKVQKRDKVCGGCEGNGSR